MVGWFVACAIPLRATICNANACLAKAHLLLQDPCHCACLVVPPRRSASILHLAPYTSTSQSTSAGLYSHLLCIDHPNFIDYRNEVIRECSLRPRLCRISALAGNSDNVRRSPSLNFGLRVTTWSDAHPYPPYQHPCYEYYLVEMVLCMGNM